MVDWSQGSGWLRLKVLLLIACIGIGLTVIYLHIRPPQPARTAPGVQGFGRSAARSADVPPESDPENDTREGRP